MGEDTVEAVSSRRAAWASGFVVGAEHEVVDHQLRAAVKQLGERPGSVSGVEPVFLREWQPRKVLTLSREFILPPGELLFELEQVSPRGEPLLPRSYFVISHQSSPLSHHWYATDVRHTRRVGDVTRRFFGVV